MGYVGEHLGVEGEAGEEGGGRGGEQALGEFELVGEDAAAGGRGVGEEFGGQGEEI